MKFIIICLVISFGAIAKGLSPSYSEPVNVYWVFRNLANEESPYHEYWKKNFKVDSNDEEIMERFFEIMVKYEKHDFSKPSSTERTNHFFKAFSSSRNVDQALKKLKSHLSAQEMKDLVKALKHFKPKFVKLFGESQLFKEKAKSLAKDFKKEKLNTVSSRINKFLGVKKAKGAKLNFVWAIPGHPYLLQKGDTLIYAINPIKDMERVSSERWGEHLAFYYMNLLGGNFDSNMSKLVKETSNGKQCEVSFLRTRLKKVLGSDLPRAKKERKKFQFFSMDEKEKSQEMIFRSLLYILVNEYIDQKKEVDVDFFKQLGIFCSWL